MELKIFVFRVVEKTAIIQRSHRSPSVKYTNCIADSLKTAKDVMNSIYNKKVWEFDNISIREIRNGMIVD